MKSVLAACASAAFMISLLAAPYAYAVIQPAYFDDLTDNPSKLNVVVSPPYGYFTHSTTDSTPDDVDEKFDSTAAIRWATTITNRNYQIKVAGVDGISEATAIQQIRNAEDLWYSTLSASSGLPTATYQTTVPASASMISFCGSNVANSVNEIDFCNVDATAITVSNGIRASGQVVTQNEVDMAFDDPKTWTATELFNVALHEFGHFYGLGEMGSFPSVYSCVALENPDPVMCDIGVTSPESLEWGDRDGIRWLYPKLVSGQNSFSLSGTVTGSDSAAALIDSGSLYDLIFVWGDYNSGTDQTSIRAKAIWDISGSTGLGGTVGTTVTLTTVSGSVNDVGATLRDVGGSGTKRELVLTYAREVGLFLFTEFVVYFDITRSGNGFTYSTPTLPQTVGGTDGDEGTDIIFFDIIQGGAIEVVNVGVFNLKQYYYYGTMSSSGGVMTWTQTGSSGTVSVATPDIGAQVPYPSQRIVTVVDQTSNGARVKEALIHFAAAGGIDGNIAAKNALGRQPVGLVTGLGAGDAINIGEQSYPEQIFSWSDSTTGYYFVEWDSRLTSHR